MAQESEHGAAQRSIAAEIRAEIESGALTPGAQLPTVEAGAERWGVAKETVRRAYAVLVAEGLVVAKSRSGYYVAGAVPGSTEARLLALEAEARETRRRLNAAGIPPAPPAE